MRAEIFDRSRRLLVVVASIVVLMATPTAGQSVVAVVTYPADAAVNVDFTKPFTWSAVANAQSYYLYVGTTAGAKDVVDSLELQDTSFSVWSLPIGRTLYARLWTQVNGV